METALYCFEKHFKRCSHKCVQCSYGWIGSRQCVSNSLAKLTIVFQDPVVEQIHHPCWNSLATFRILVEVAFVCSGFFVVVLCLPYFVQSFLAAFKNKSNDDNTRERNSSHPELYNSSGQLFTQDELGNITYLARSVNA